MTPWYFGVMDNGGANATMLEVARLLVAERAQWRRGLRLCFWSGHSHGRYAGSTWYADNHWLELERRCVAHVNVDSIGAMGNTVLADAPASAELVAFGGDAVATRGGQELDGQRMARAGDQSFWGIGLPSLFMGMGEQPASNAASNPRAGMGGGNRKGAGFGWWWHTPDDTLDKMDRELLVRDTRIYVHTICRLLTDPVLPFDYAAHATYLRNVLRPLQDALGTRLDITDVLDGVEALEAAAGMARHHAADPAKHDALNAALMKTSRAMVPMDYTAGDRFAHGPALPHTPYPVLDPVRRLAAASDPREAAQLTIGARRACNRLAHALLEAVDALSAWRVTTGRTERWRAWTVRSLSSPERRKGVGFAITQRFAEEERGRL